MIGFETALGLAGRELIEKKYITWSTLVEKMSSNPAKILGLVNKGEVAEGKDADMILVDPDKEWFFRKEDIVSKGKNSPFIDEKLKGRVELTVCGGKITYQA
jgi:dihydroorotase